MRLSNDQMDRACGVLLGQACGDALGVPYEFGPPLAPDQLPAMSGGGLGPYLPGEYSDDTQMAVCIAEVASTGKPLTSPQALEAIAANFVRWRTAGASDIGTQTRAVLDAARRHGTDLTTEAAAYSRRNPRRAGNGALMRTAVVGLSSLLDRAQTARSARAVASLTHADPLAGDSCVLWCEAIRLAVLHGRLDARAGLDLIPASRQAQWSTWIDEAEAGPPTRFSPNGFTVTALQAAWAAIAATMQPGRPVAYQVREALCAAVRIGDDTDTVAAIAGGLLGAYAGATAIPDEWRSAVRGWPGLRAPDLVRLAALTAAGGRDGVSSSPDARMENAGEER